jgi:membrane associated rhomboid family serine protease
MEGRRRESRHTNGLSPILISLLIQLYQQLERSNFKPPITIALIFINIMVHIHPSPYFLDIYLGDMQRICIQPRKIVETFFYRGELLWSRLFLSSVVHADDMHLYYNMLSLCWKGVHLESELGSHKFGFLVIYSLIASHTIMVALAYILYEFFQFDGHNSGYNTCAVGFSAVLFSLKYVWNSKSTEYSSVMGFMLPTKFAAWAELVAISLISPNASFIGHLSGILAGCAYAHGPVGLLFGVPNFLSSVFQKLTGPAPSSRTYGSGTPSARSSSTIHSSQDKGKGNKVYVQLDDGEEIELEYLDGDDVGNKTTKTASLNVNKEDVRKQRLDKYDKFKK